MDKQVIIVIGLPGSGKTFFCQDICSAHGHKLFDDFLNNFYDGELLEALQLGNKVCINDPRLCQYPIFEKYMTIFSNYVGHDNIHVYLFENDPDQCTKNIIRSNDTRKGLVHTITSYSKHYTINNYSKWDHNIVLVYREPEQDGSQH